MPSPDGIVPPKFFLSISNSVTLPLSGASTPSHCLMLRLADQFRLPVVPSSVDFAASSVSQSDTSPG